MSKRYQLGEYTYYRDYGRGGWIIECDGKEKAFVARKRDIAYVIGQLRRGEHIVASL